MEDQCVLFEMGHNVFVANKGQKLPEEATNIRMADYPKHFVGLYLPVKGWAWCLYGPEGPWDTGFGHASPEGAYEEARSSFEDIPIVYHSPEELAAMPAEEAARSARFNAKIKEIQANNRRRINE